METETEELGKLLEGALNNFVSEGRKWQDFYLGQVVAYKAVLDTHGEGKYARDVIRSTLSNMSTFNRPKIGRLIGVVV